MPDPGATAAANHGIGFLFTELIKHIKEWRNVREACDQLQRDLDICVAYREDVLRKGDGGTKVVREYDEELSELVHDIQDCLERFLYRVTCKDEAGWLAQKGHAIWTWRIRRRFAKELKNLNKRLQKSGVEKMRPVNVGTTAAPAVATRCCPIEENPVGIDQAKKELLTLLNEEGPEAARLRVIAVVGFGGSGKTTLARAVYRSASTEGSFGLCAWVDRADYQDACGLLKTIFLKFWKEEKSFAESSNERVLQDELIKRLKQQSDEGSDRAIRVPAHATDLRYLIVLDDMNMDHWEWIKQTFHDNGRSCRIMVTVRTLPAANDCISNKANCNGYVYHMRTLGDEGSKTVACLTEFANDDTQNLLQKCDGHPLSLVSVGGHFRCENKGRPTRKECKKLCEDLGSFLHDNANPTTTGDQRDPFSDLRDVLMSNYTNLPSGTLRTSLLYLGIFPDARQLKRNKITRRWVAEGYAPPSSDHKCQPQKEADNNFKILIDKNIIQSTGICNSYKCKAQGIMHEFVLHKSMSENFIRTFDAAQQSNSPTLKQRKKKVRHFVVRGRNTVCSGAAVNMDLSHIRSMTVLRVVTDNGDNLGSGGARQGGAVGHRSGSEGYAFLEFSKYKVIRVLDLGECVEVKNSHLENICKLWNLRYLSLGDKVNKVPKEISQLKLLETLHLSKAVETELPMDIVHMPSLIHLSGRLMLPESEVITQPQLVRESESELQTLPGSKSKLQTLSGIVASRRQGFLQLIPQMKKLRKIKICFGQSRESVIDLTNPMLAAIKSYLEHELERSLGLDFSNLYGTGYRDYPQMVMERLHSTLSSDRKYYLTSLKLHLRDELVSSMPQFIFRENLCLLEKLCLSLTSVTQNLLLNITENLLILAHLKLKADRIHMDLEIQEGKFQRLESLCFIVEEFCKNEDGSMPQIHVQGILPELRSFQFLCKNLVDLCGIDINMLENLQEIELDGDVSVAARQQWETAARNHLKRPNVLPFLSVDDPGSVAIPAAGSAQVVHSIPAAAAAVIITPEGSQLEGYEPAANQDASTSLEVDEPDRRAQVTATISNVHGLMLSEVDNDAPVDYEDEIVRVANGAEGGDEPTQVATISAPANDDSPFAANSVAGPERGMPNKLNNIGSESPMDIDKGAPDATIPVLTVSEVPNNTSEHNASRGVHVVHAR